MSDGSNGGQSASDKLNAMLGFDPTKRATLGPVGSDLFKDALSDIVKERQEKAKALATELFRKAITLQEERKKAHRAFQQADHKFEKELGKVLNEIQGLAGGKEPEVTDEAQTA